MNREALQERLKSAFLLAPLTKGGNLPFRRLCVEYGADITVSEMVYSRPLVKGDRKERALLRRHPSEQCFGVQMAVRKPQEAVSAGRIIEESGADFVDINCGCPIDGVTRKGLGASLLQRPKLIEEVVRALTKALSIAVTVKIRTGWKDGQENYLEVGKRVEDAGAAALAVHGRTREQRYSRAASWEKIHELATSLSIPVIGNGDVLTRGEAEHHSAKHGITALMLARGALIKPWLFREIKEKKSWRITSEERIGEYYRFVEYLKEHFRDDDLGKRRILGFLPWHFSLFHRYQFFEQEGWSPEAPLIHQRSEQFDEGTPLDHLLRSPNEMVHHRIATELLEAASIADAVTRLHELASTEEILSFIALEGSQLWNESAVSG